MNNVKEYRIKDNHTGQFINSTLYTMRAAHNRADKLDLKYGAVRYIVVRVAA
jgi:hypothetical protein